MKPSTLRISAGSLRGRLVSFEPLPDVRPTAAKVREAVFNMARLLPCRGFIDACAGSGIMGFEAISRGFDPVVFVDPKPAAIKSIKENANALAVEASFICASAFELKNQALHAPAWLCYADPPFRIQGFHQRLLASLRVFDPNAEFFYLAESEEPVAPPPDSGFALLKRKKYGRTHIAILQRTAGSNSTTLPGRESGEDSAPNSKI